MTIQEIDRNFARASTLPQDLRYVEARSLELRGLSENEYRRLPLAMRETVNSGVQELMFHTAGGRVRFVTDSTRLAVAWTLRDRGHMAHMTAVGSAGLELYDDAGRQIKSFIPEFAEDGRLARDNAGWTPLAAGKRGYELYLPLYNGLEALYIGLDEGARLEKPPAYAVDLPVTFYGSSITQGGCASKPGSCFAAICCRRLGADMRNLGFSGSGRGETHMAEHIAKLPMSAFVLDYDHNAPDAEHLRATHKPFYEIVRAAQPNLPIVMVSKPDFDNDPAQSAIRRGVIRETYEYALRQGDARVRFLDGETLFGTSERGLCTVDGCHPNDIGFLRMADALTPLLAELLG